jgi:hypothetical protein
MKYFSHLRGINVSGKKVIKIELLRDVFVKWVFRMLIRLFKAEI